MIAMILAAGRGERMRPLTDVTPKPMLKVAGKPLIEYHIEKLASAGCERIVINLAHLGEQIRGFIGSGSRYGVEICYSLEESGGLETAGGIRKALPLLGSQPFWLVNGDIWCESDFSRLPKELAAGDLGCLQMVDNPHHNPKGDFLLCGGRLSDGAGERLTYSGIALLAPQLVADLPVEKRPLAPLLRKAMGNGSIAGERLAGRWCDVGTPERLDRINNVLLGEGIS